jgi:protoporphyrinogen/coproporphyrinogen III oxidase
MKKHIIVIGGGIAGTAAAYNLNKKGYIVTILEKNDRLGGRIHSVSVNGVAVELGAGFLTNSYYNVLSFITEAGLSKQLFTQRSNSGIIQNNTFHSPAELFFILSLRSKVVFTKLFIAILLLWFRIDIKNPGKIKAFDTKSVTDMFQKRPDRQVLEYIFQPILNGYCFWTPEQTSQAMLMVITKFLLKGGRYRLQKGLQQIPEMAAKGCNLFFNCHVTRVKRDKKGHYIISFKNQGKMQTVKADGIICATTASGVPHIFSDLSRLQKTFFSSVDYSSTVVVAQVYQQKKTSKDVAMAIPRIEKKDIATITVATDKHLANPFYRSVKVYIPGKKQIAKSDAAIQKIVATEISPLRKVFLTNEAQLLASSIHRWNEAIPVFQKGSMDRLTRLIQEIENPTRPLVFAGDYLTGPCIEWAFISGKQAAERLDQRLKKLHH